MATLGARTDEATLASLEVAFRGIRREPLPITGLERIKGTRQQSMATGFTVAKF
jgi:hypothetical protein